MQLNLLIQIFHLKIFNSNLRQRENYQDINYQFNLVIKFPSLENLYFQSKSVLKENYQDIIINVIQFSFLANLQFQKQKEM